MASANIARRGLHNVAVATRVTKPAQVGAIRFNSTTSSSLTDVLAREIAEEKGNDEIDQDLIDIQTQIMKSFKLHDEPGKGEVRLTRKFGDEHIEIVFDCQDELDVEDNNGMEDMDEEDEQNEGEDDEEAPEGSGSYGINLEVHITKGKTKLLLDCLATDSLQIQNVRIIDGKHADVDLMKMYGGPKFDDVDEELQGAFYEYLTERHIDDDLSFFILAYSREKEQKEYVNWLEKIQDFTAPAAKK